MDILLVILLDNLSHKKIVSIFGLDRNRICKTI